jgi:hypothetical protein
MNGFFDMVAILKILKKVGAGRLHAKVDLPSANGPYLGRFHHAILPGSGPN